MNDRDLSRFYRPATKHVTIDGQNLAIFDPEIANVRAQYYLSLAQDLIRKQCYPSNENINQINHALTNAVDFGSKEAAYLLATRILAGMTGSSFLLEDAIIFIRIAAERGHKKACSRMALCYAGSVGDADLMRAGDNYFSAISEDDREVLASYYLEQAQ